MANFTGVAGTDIAFERRGADTLANTATQGFRAHGQITYLADGRLLIVWRDGSGAGGGDVRGRIYDRDGAPVGGELPLTAKPGVETMPFAFALPGGGFVLTWAESLAGTTDRNIVAQMFDSAGAAVGSQIDLHPANPLDQAWPVGAALAGGGFVIAWHDYGADPAAATADSPVGIRAQRFDSEGAPVGGVVEVNMSEEGIQANVAVTALADGGWLAVWEDFGSQSGIAARRYGADGSPAGGELLVTTETAGTQQHSVTAALPGGGFVIAWTGRSADGAAQAVRAKIYGADGAPLADEFIVNQGTSGFQSFPAIAVLASGDFVISWRDGTGRDGSYMGVRAQVFDGTGGRIGGEFIVNTVTYDDQENFSAAAYGNEFAVAWIDYSEYSNSGSSGYSSVRFARFVAAPGTEAGDSISGSAGGDDIHGFGGNDSLHGLGGDDRLYGNDGGDLLQGGEGNDLLDAGAGNNRLDGGDGNDVLNAGTGDDTLDGGDGNDVLHAGSGDDTAEGGEGDDVLDAGTGDDTLEGGDGNDVLDAGTGVDILRGGAGDDRLIVQSGAGGETDTAEGGTGTDRLEADLSAAASAVTLNVAAGAAGGLDGWLGTGSGRALDFTGIEQFDLNLSDFAEDFTGGDLADILRGRGGDDVLGGAGGDDLLDGGEGVDRMTGGAGNDQYVVDDSADLVVEAEGAGTDTVITTLERYTLGRNFENLTGSAANQHLAGNRLDNVILGGGGNDRLEDQLGGNDTLDGGAGDDFLYADRTALPGASRPNLLGGAGNDEIRFKGGSADINGGDGNDRVILDNAAAGVTLGLGNDQLKLSAGSTAAVYDFNASTDRLDFHAVLGANIEGWDQTANPFTTNLARVESYYSGAYAQVLFRNGTGYHDFASFLYIEKMHFNRLTDSALGGFTQESTAAATTVTGTQAGETLYGTAGDNVIEGLGGADRIEGGFGADTLRGGEGDDYLNGQTGHDTVSGGAGNDHLVDDSGGGDTLNGDEGNDLIEAVRAFKMVKRTLNLNGGDGDDEIVYTQLPDYHGQAGVGFTVNIDAGEGADLVRLGARSGTTTVTLGAGTDTLRLAPETGGTINITDFQAGAGGDRIDLRDYLGVKLVNWNQSDNPFATGHLELAALSPTETALRVDLNGGGNSFILLATFKGSASLGFTAENFLGFDPGGAAVAAGPGFSGTADDDAAAGTVGADSLSGLAGDDRLSGGLGSDLLDGGDGEDRLSGGGGDDLVSGGDGDDLIEESDGGNDQLNGGAGDDQFVITRAAAGTPGTTLLATGGEGADRFDVTSWSSAALTLDGGAGDDVVRFFKLMGSARVTLGEGRDVIRLEPAYFGPHTNQIRVKEIAVTDFQTGPGGDFVDFKEALAYGAMHWPDDGEGFRNGTLRIRQDGADTLVQYSYSSDGDYQTLFRFVGKQAAEFTRDSFGLDLPTMLVIDKAGAQVVNADDIFGVPAVRITATDVHFTNAMGSIIEGIGFSTPGGTTISIEASGATIVNRGLIRGNIEGSGFDDRVENFTTISGKVNLGAGNDSYFERFTGALHSGTNVDLGSGDDSAEIELTANYLGLSLIGGAGHDTLTIRNITGKTSVSNYVSFSAAGFEQLNLHGTAGASIDFGGHPAVENIHVHGGLTLNVPNRLNGTTPYTLAPAGNVHLHGSNLTAGLNWSFKTITGSDLAEKVELTSSAPLAAGTAAKPVESISLGGGDDRLRWGGTQAQPGSADGGDGRDWLSVDLVAAVQDLSAFTGFETIEINNFFLNGSAPVRKIGGIGAVTERLLFTPSVSVQPPAMAFELEGVLPGLIVGAGQAQITLLTGSTIAGLSDRYLVDSTILNASSQQIVNRGSILGAAALGGGNDSFVNFGAVGGNVDLGEGNDLFTGHSGGSVAGKVLGGAGDDVYVIDGNHNVEEAAGEGLDEVRTALAAYVLGANVENLTATSDISHDFRGNSGNNVVTGGAGGDTLRLQDGGDDRAIGGGGNDWFLFGGALTGSDIVDGGEGKDEVTLQGDYSAGLTLGAFTGVEVMVLLPGNDIRFGAPGNQLYSYSIVTTDLNVASGVQLSVDANRLRAGENLVFDGSAETDGSFYIFAGKGVDILTGGAKNDAFLFRGPGNFTGADTVNGGAGFDELALRGDYTGANKVVFGATTISGIEAIVVVSGHDLRYGKFAGDYSFDLTMNESSVASGQVMFVDAGTLRSGERLVFDGSAETDGGRFTMFGGKGGDTLTGGSGADSIRGGLGADAMKGNGGADTFVFRDTADSANGAVDHILDFVSGNDRIDLTRIDANSLAGGDQAFDWIGSNAFSGSGAASAGQLRAYQDGASWFVEGDTNGDGNADLVIQVTGAALTQGDFLP